MTKSMTPFNLNDVIRFKPNPEALERYKKRWADWLAPRESDMELIPDENGFCVMQLHEFITVFGGDGFTQGCRCIVDTRVFFEIEVTELAVKREPQYTQFVVV
jgi:hypothetical protein